MSYPALNLVLWVYQKFIGIKKHVTAIFEAKNKCKSKALCIFCGIMECRGTAKMCGTVPSPAGFCCPALAGFSVPVP